MSVVTEAKYASSEKKSVNAVIGGVTCVECALDVCNFGPGI